MLGLTEPGGDAASHRGGGPASEPRDTILRPAGSSPSPPQLKFTADFAARPTLGVPLTICGLGEAGERASGRSAGVQTPTGAGGERGSVEGSGPERLSDALPACLLLPAVARPRRFLRRAGREASNGSLLGFGLSLQALPQQRAFICPCHLTHEMRLHLSGLQLRLLLPQIGSTPPFFSSSSKRKGGGGTLEKKR